MPPKIDIKSLVALTYEFAGPRFASCPKTKAQSLQIILTHGKVVNWTLGENLAG